VPLPQRYNILINISPDIGKKDFADTIVNDLEMGRLSWIIWLGPV
jgi:hypothetical protein